jgi:hypothetical protein
VLRVDAGATCLDSATLAEAVQTWLGRETVDGGVAFVEVRGDTARTDAVAIAVEVRGERIERSFDPAPAACAELHAVVGLAVAIAVDTSVLEGLGYDVVGPDEPTSPQAYDPERPPLTRRKREGSPPTGRREPRVAVTAAIRGEAWLALLPGIGAGGAGQIELGWRRFVDLRLAAFGGYGGERTIGAESVVGLGLVGGRIDVCAALPRKRVRPRLCFGPAAGALAIGSKAPGVRDAVAPYAALMLTPELRIHATKTFSLDLFAALVVPVVRPVLAERDPSKAGMIGAHLAVPPVGAVIGLGAAFSIR